MEPMDSDDWADLRSELQAGLKQLGLSLPASTQELLLEFLKFLQKWNTIYNLTAHRELEQMLIYHVLDSLAISPYITGKRILDVGTGAGFPGIPLALLFPEKSFVLMDSAIKKTTFLLQAVATFKISNITVVHSRVESYKDKQGFDTIVTRAWGKIKDMIDQTRQVMRKKGRWLLMKGKYPKEELKAIYRPFVVHRLRVPYLHAKRHVIIIENDEG